MTLVIDLPMPPSVNGIWRHGTDHNGKVRRFKTAKYRSWLDACNSFCIAHGWHKNPIRGPFHAVVTIDEKRRRKNSDIDNRAKATFDALQRMGVIENDKLAESVTIKWGEAPEGCRVELTPFLLPAEDA